MQLRTVFASLAGIAALAVCGGRVLCGAQNAAGTINTFAGKGGLGFSGDGGPATSAQLSSPNGLAVDKAGNLFIVDAGNHRIRKVDTSGIISTVAGNGGTGFSGDGGPATSATFSWGFNGHLGIAVDGSGNLYIPDLSNQRVRKVDSNGIITTVAGNGVRTNSGDGGPATSAGLVDPIAVAVDGSGNLYIAEFAGNRVRKVNTSGIITTAAGGGPLGSNGDGGPATSAVLNAPFALALDGAGNLYIGDTTARLVRKVNASGIITTVAGNGSTTDSGDGGPATKAGFALTGLAADGAGDVFISESSNRIREVNGSGTINTYAGTGMGGYSGDGGSATGADLSEPGDVTVDAGGNLYIADMLNSRVRKVTSPAPPAPSITHGGVVPVYSGAPNIQAGEWVSIYGANLAGSTVAWNGDFPTNLGNTSVTINGKPAYLWFVSPTQINLQAPDDSTTGTVQVVVSTPGGTVTSTATLAPFAPSFSLLDGKHATGIILRSNGSGAYGGGAYDIIGPTGSSLGYPTVAAAAGDSIVLFAVGLGPTNPAVQAGQVFSGAAPTTNPVNLSLNNVNVLPTFSGLTSAGLYQINAMVPAGLGTGDVPLAATVGGTQTPAGVVIALQ
jgi:uncharacterized protein (TIGR03437 family)